MILTKSVWTNVSHSVVLVLVVVVVVVIDTSIQIMCYIMNKLLTEII